jgi:hypothetical protein
MGRDGSPSRPHSARSENPPYPWQENRFGWRVAAGVIPKGNRRPDDWRGCPFSGLGSRPSGTWFGRSGSGAGSGNLPSVICHRFRWRVAAPGGRWRVLSIQPSMQSSTQSSTQSSNFASVIRHLPSIQPSIQHRYVVTRSRPYPARRSREVEAVSGWRLGTQPRQTRAARSAAPTPRQALP